MSPDPTFKIDKAEFHLSAWYEFFKEYAKEPVLNTYVKNFDTNYALRSVVKTFISDFLMYQVFTYSRNFEKFKGSPGSEKDKYQIYLPTQLKIEGRNEVRKEDYKSFSYSITNPDDFGYCRALEALFTQEWKEAEKKHSNERGDDKVKKVQGCFEKSVITKIQKDILEEDVLFKEPNPIYKEAKIEFINQDSGKHIHSVYTASDKTDEIEYQLEFANEDEKKFTPDEIVEQLIYIAIFTKRNKLADDFKIQQSIRSAIARVMTRNMSHNIGSHVLSRMVDPNSISQESITSDNKLLYRSIFENELGCYKNVEIERLGDKENFYNKLLATFFSYLKSRQDFLADVVSGRPQIQTTKFFVNDVMKGIDENRLLLNRISGLENFQYGFSFEGGLIESEIKPDGLIEYSKDVTVAISNDIMGQHAFYVILENIIRNTAKHGKKADDGKLHNIKIVLKESETDSSLYQLTVYDDIEMEGTCVLKIERREKEEELYKKHEVKYDAPQLGVNEIQGGVIDIPHENQHNFIKSFSLIKEYRHLGYETIFGENQKSTTFDYFEVNKIDQLVISQNILINKPILNEEEFDLRLHALGLIEMETCAAYLRRIPIEKIESPEFRLKFCKTEKEEYLKEPNKELRLLRAVRPEKNGETKKCLGYRFYIPKPKELLILDAVGKTWEAIPEKERKSLESNGILLLDARSVESSGLKNKGEFDSKKVYPHEMRLTIGDVKKIEKSHVPKRHVTLDEFRSNYVEYHKKELNDDQSFNIIELLKEDNNVLKLEVLRAIVSERYKQKGLSPQLLLYKKCINNNTGSHPYPISLSPHGKNYKGNRDKDYIEIHASRHDTLRNIINQRGTLSPHEESIRLKFLEAAVSNVLIIDERIQEGGKNEYFLENNETIPSMKYRELWDEANVIIPDDNDDDAIKLSASVLQNELDKKLQKLIIKEFGDNSERKCKGLDYIIVHLGIIDRYLDKENKKKEDNRNRMDFLNSLTEGLNLKKTPHLIIASGRAPEDLPEGVSFISYSTLSQYVIEDRFKYKLIEVLNSSRRKNE